jgi:hypothetical protein
MTLAIGATLWVALASADPAASGVTLTPCHIDGVQEELRCGVYNVFENRRTLEAPLINSVVILIPQSREKNLSMDAGTFCVLRYRAWTTQRRIGNNDV